MNVMSTTPMILPRNSPHSGGRSLLKPPEKPPLGKGKERKAGGCRCGNATACPGMPFKTINLKKKKLAMDSAVANLCYSRMPQ